MLHVYFGTDRQAVRTAATDYIESQLPTDGTVTTLSADGYQTGQLSDALGAASLFGGVEWFVLDTPSESTEFAEAVVEAVAELAASVNTFIILEGPLLAAEKKRYVKYAENTQEFTAEKGESFNAFQLADALTNRDKRRLWVLLQEAKLNGMRPEEIVGILWWQMKMLSLAQKTHTAEEAGVKAFPYGKAKRALAKFSNNEVDEMTHALLELYHKAHAGLGDMEVALERWVLQQ